jgi:hypothetical protein
MTSVDKFKSMISKRGGVATNNRFMVFMTPPTQALIDIDIQGAISSALSGTFSLGSFVSDPRDISLLCDSCTMPGRGIITSEYVEVSKSHKMPYGYIFTDVDFSFILTNDSYIRKMFERWQAAVIDFDKYRLRYNNEYTTDVVIMQLSKKNVPIYGVKLKNAYPIAVSPVSLSNEETSVLKMTVTLTFDDFVVEGPVSSTLSAVRTALNSLNNIV